MCKVLQIHPSVYYYHQHHVTNHYHEDNKELDQQIMTIWLTSKKRYGSPKIRQVLIHQGNIVSQKRVARRMRILGIKSIVTKKYHPATNSNQIENQKEYPNLLDQNFLAKKPGEKWVGDITYIYTVETGWTYLAIVMDLYSLKVIGWSYGMKMDDSLVIKALNKALSAYSVSNDLIFHSDRGSQYTSNEFEQVLLKHSIKHSYSKKGYPYDNASMESFNSILKKEEINLNTYQTFQEAKMVIFEFIESWYNRNRIHSTLDYITPCQKEQSYFDSIQSQLCPQNCV